MAAVGCLVWSTGINMTPVSFLDVVVPGMVRYNLSIQYTVSLLLLLCLLQGNHLASTTRSCVLAAPGSDVHAVKDHAACTVGRASYQ